MRNYLIVTASYWGFTLTDGALRMLVLLHFYRLGYSPFTLALLFLLYEAAGIIANLGGGWMATRFGIRRMLGLGLGLQIVGLMFLSVMSPEWSVAFSIVWVLAAQGLAGVAKDITKTASKSAIKITSVDGNNQMFRWVAWFTGSKNATKGIGFFAGGLLLDAAGFEYALWSMAGLLGFILFACVPSLPSRLGVSASSKTVRELFGKSKGVNILAAARIFMFGARDVWFVVGLPVFLYSAGWSFWEVGGFLAVWTIAYGAIQAIAPSLVRRSKDGLSREVPAARLWGYGLAAVPALLIGALELGDALSVSPQMIVVVGLTIFGLPFAVNSSLHSYLILAYAGSRKAAEDVGFYYAANAAGRLMGTLLSGALYQVGGLTACLLASFVMLALSAAISMALPPRTIPDIPPFADG
ncbi:MAG: MFS transporter [Rhodospirillaceae bacterium]|nr:MFS transporter [Rhodospirillaceae bacterium]OUX26312.1 MAG: MFS transporter [Rhodospirillaceae bacterium TMED256]|tara:strand:+ start:2308 stop:3540 length:1233 start_codon:yes stop_codon:yes gene_type:complete